MTWGLWNSWLLPGVWITLQVLVGSTVLAAVIAFAVGLGRSSRRWIVRFLSGVYFEVFRGTSALVLMFWMFFVMPLAFGWQLVPVWAAVLALGLSYGAYGSEVVRGALQSVAPAQREAGIALGFTPAQRLRRIILPQAWPEMIPPFNNLLIELMKGTALVSVISVADITFAAGLIRNATGESDKIYTIILLMYFVLAFFITRGMRVLERSAKARIGRPSERKGSLFPSARGKNSRGESEGTAATLPGGAR